MFKRFLSHLIIAAAVLCLTTTFFIWVIDAVVLAPNKLVPALRSSGVPGAVATAIPNLATSDAPAAEKADLKNKITAVITPAYIDQKMQSIVESTTGFIHGTVAQPVVDLTDFPAKLRDTGVNVGSDINKNFAQPILLNKDGKLNNVPRVYKTVKLLKYAGIVLFVLLLLAEWFIAEKGTKLRRAGRIFLHAGLAYLGYYVVLIGLPLYILPKLKNTIKPDANVGILIDDFAKGLQALFGQYFLGFALACLTIAAALYVARHGHKHVQAIVSTTDAKKPLARKKPESTGSANSAKP